MINLIIDNVNCKIDGDLDLDLIKKLDKLMSYDHPGYMFMKGGKGGYGLRGKYGGWDGKIRLLSKSMRFPVGLLSMAENFFKENKIIYNIIDVRPDIKYGKALPLYDKDINIRPYQEQVIKAARDAGSGIMKVATGGGKSLIIASIVAKYNIPTWLMNRRKDRETGEDKHILSSDLDLTKQFDIRFMRKVKSYKGVRHAAKSKKVRGQSTKSTGRTGTVATRRKETK